MEEARSLILIPDISGFTDFVQQTEKLHSKHIISELLELLLKANILDLRVAEIEGDAIFFYKEGYIPKPEELSNQVRNMFISFHSHLRSYDAYRICQCGACSTASGLSLKFIVHIGSFDFIKIKNFKKPHGEDVILAHKLLKNNIKNSEYLLLTENVIHAFPDQQPVIIKDSQEIFDGSMKYKSLGSIRYRYIPLNPLHKEVKELPPNVHPDKNSNPVHFNGIINTSKEKVLEFASNLEYRLKINRNVSSLDYENDRVNRSGLVHEYIINNR
ncbi:MAG: DUF2652 domain-containing protein, partial [Candidatus Heimdallarchaeota archaeon]|nr:DUF2652 domain-containing protein [Candidatus Heimdallarchaeota archaeon]